jgi:hypothetical protein
MKKKKKKKFHKNTFLSSRFHHAFQSSEVQLLNDINLLRLRENSSPTFINNTRNIVSDFSGWVYESVIGKIDSKKLQEGKKFEQLLSKSLDDADEEWRRGKYDFITNEWELEFEDITSGQYESFKISSLQYHDSPFYGKPDVVYRNTRTNDRIIVEIKKTSHYTNIPKGGWYNLQCQLWAYSLIDDFQDSENIYLYGDVRRSIRHNNHWGVYTEEEFSGVNPGWQIRKNGKSNLDNHQIDILHKQCKQMLEFYGGVFINDGSVEKKFIVE